MTACTQYYGELMEVLSVGEKGGLWTAILQAQLVYLGCPAEMKFIVQDVC